MLAALGLRNLSMRPASIGPVKALIRRTDLAALRAVVIAEIDKGVETIRPAVMDFLAKQP